MSVQTAMGRSQFIYTKEMKYSSYLSKLAGSDEYKYETIRTLYRPDMVPLIPGTQGYKVKITTTRPITF